MAIFPSPRPAIPDGSRRKPRGLHAVALSLLVAFGLAAFYNHRFWQVLVGNSATDTFHGLAFVVASFVFIALWLSLFVHLTSVRRVFKPLLIALLLIAALADYFTARYGVIIDKSMIQNIVQTDTAEATELLSGDLLRHLLIYFALPALAIAWVPLRRQTLASEVRQRVAVLALSLVVMGGLFLGFNKDFTFLFRQHPELRSLITPTYPIHAGIKYLRERNRAPTERVAIALDAHRADDGPRNISIGAKRPTLFVMVVGETARAENFGLNGYARDTTPELGALNVVDFRHTESCGTSTAESLPCMFSHLAHDDYDSAEAAGYDNLLDVLARAEVPVLWVDNQGGCKGVCDRVEHVYTRDLNIAGLCADGECHDEIMLRTLRERVLDNPDANGDRFVVLHQMGSHGPAYYKRVPDAFRRFTPECRSVNLQECSAEEVRNSYDNTIAYTDHVLAETIRLLAGHQDEYDIALYYVSDHGESLGEKGLYLHGMPYLLAPDQQTRVPAIMWLSEGFTRSHGVARPCLHDHDTDVDSHDNIFHTVLGAFDVETQEYQVEKDLLAVCRAPRDGVHVAGEPPPSRTP
ncbi:MAG: phosphoethanolamine--lipid A transferase [Gammaproteobacteria bacterium]|nr:phosphoethanolamine--lipid A transferase [Gammaproteobacteria bacterium]